MTNCLIVIDMQNDFIDGSLGTPEAQAIVPNVKNKIDEYIKAEKNVFFTKDTHYSDYLHTLEGEMLPVEHCIRGTKGWEISEDIKKDMSAIHIIEKNTFGYINWDKYNSNLFDIYDSIEICGLCTDICVISNALILRALYPNTHIIVDSSCCAGVTPKKHEAALEVMRSCQIEVI